VYGLPAIAAILFYWIRMKVVQQLTCLTQAVHSQSYGLFDRWAVEHAAEYISSEAAEFYDTGAATDFIAAVIQHTVSVDVVRRHSPSISNSCNDGTAAGSGGQLAVWVAVKPNDIIFTPTARRVIVTTRCSCCIWWRWCSFCDALTAVNAWPLLRRRLPR